MKGKTSKKLIKGEKGQALVIVLVMMLFGSLIVAPVLSYVSSGLRVGQDVYEERMYLLYAADSGVEDAIWQVNNKKLNSDLFGDDDPDYDQYAYSDYRPIYTWDYELLPDADGNKVNDKDVLVTLENAWIPKDIDAPEPGEARLIVEGTAENPPKLMIVGGLSGTSATQYQIGIIYYYGSEGPSALQVQEVGIWLPTGFHYAGDCSLAGDPDTAPYSEPDVDEHYKSGEAVVWTFGSVLLNDFSGSGGTGSPMVKSFTFQFSGPSQQFPAAAISWIDTTGVSGIDYAWDADVQIYKIISTAGGVTGKETTVEAYAAKIEMRKLGAEVSGDYVAVGNTLMMPDPDYSSLRNRLLKESSAAITSGSGEGQIPDNATMKAAYLYWSGFIDHYYWYWYTSQGRRDPYSSGWYFSSDADNLTGQIYDADDLPGIIAAAKINTVSFGTTGAMQNVTANHWQVCIKTNDSPNCWYYCCLYDATTLVEQFIEDGRLGPNGSGTYTLSHTSGVIDQTPPRPNFPRTPDLPSSDHTSPGYSFYLYDSSGSSTVGYTGYPLGTPATKLPGDASYDPNKQIPNTGNTQNRYNASYAGWSLVIIYSSPDTKGHQLYLYDIKNPNFTFAEGFGSNADPDFDGDGQPGGKVSGFLVPPQISDETNAAKLTCFVGEGDEGNVNDYIKMTGPSGTWKKLWDGITTTSNTKYSPNNIWNSRSLVLGAVSGVDIDTPGIDPTAVPAQYITWSSNVLRPGDTYAEINLPSPNDGFTLIYIILSFRSEVSSGGILSYLVR